MEPITIAAVAAIAVGSAAVQWWNSKQAQNASQEEREKMRRILEAVQEPDFDFSNFSPEDMQVVSKFIPETVPYIEAAAPEVVKASPIASQGREAEMRALEQYKSLAQSGTDPLTEIARDQSARRAAANAQSNRATIDQQMTRRGLGGGSGIGYAGALQGSSDAYQADALAGEQAAIAEAQRRDQALGQSAALGGRIFESEADLAAKNANILNQFNQWATQNRQNWQQSQADTRNRGQLWNAELGHRVSDENTKARNAAKLRNIDNANTLRQKQFDNRFAKATGQNKIGEQAIGGIMSGAAQSNQAIQGLGEAATSTIDRYDRYSTEQEKKRKNDPYMRN